MPTYKNIIGFYIEPAQRPTWSGEILDLRTGELVKEPSMTKQSFKEECDINNIVRKFEATGQVDHINQAAAAGHYTDLPSGLDLQAALEIKLQAEAGFMALPASLRAQFDNDPVKWVTAMESPTEAQLKQFAELGLVTIREPETAVEAPKPQQTPSPAKE